MSFLPQQQSSLTALASYSNLAGDFVATPTTSSKDVVLSSFASSAFSASIALNSFASAIVQRISSAGLVEPVATNSVSYNSGTATLTLNQLSSNFASGDTVAIVMMGPLRAYDTVEDVLNINMPAPRAGENFSTDRMMVEQFYRPLTLSASGTTTLQLIPGFLHRIIATGGPTGTIKVYDNMAGSGTLIADYDGTNFFDHEINTVLTIGLTVVLSANTKLTFIVR